MSFLDTLRKDKMEALKSKDTVKNGVCSLLISAIALKEKEGHAKLSDDEAMSYVQKELKQTKEALSLTPADRMDLIEETKRKIEILEAYLPKQMSADELQAAILEILEEKQLERSNKSKGILIKETLARYPGKTDGKAVNQALAQLLK